MLTVLDLFSGIGAFSLGLEATGGYRTLAFCEMNPFCQFVLRSHWPEVMIYGDVQFLTGNRLRTERGRPNVICGGFSCQDVSSMGKRMGLAGSRSGLWMHFARLVGELQPDYAIVENVAALNFRGLGVVLGDLASIGYDAEWHIIPASAFGAPHERERCWIIAHPKSVPRLYEPHIAEAAARLLNDAPPWNACPWETPAAGVCGVDDGIPNRVDRTEKLGNSLVPIIPQIIGHAILAERAAGRPPPGKSSILPHPVEKMDIFRMRCAVQDRKCCEV